MGLVCRNLIEEIMETLIQIMFGTIGPAHFWVKTFRRSLIHTYVYFTLDVIRCKDIYFKLCNFRPHKLAKSMFIIGLAQFSMDLFSLG
jgi:hypothetical protein